MKDLTPKESNPISHNLLVGLSNSYFESTMKLFREQVQKIEDKSVHMGDQLP